MNRIAFYGGFIILLVGLVVWILRPNQSAGKSEISLFGAKFTFDTPAFAVMVIGLALMLFSTRFPDAFGPSPEPIKKIVCTGEKEQNCPGAHDIFYLCGYFGTDQQIADDICRGRNSSHIRTNTTDGGRCGYALIEVTCQ
jgi:hypothetical protein